MKHLISIIALAAAAASAAAAVKTPMQAEVKVADPQARALVSKLVVERSQNILFVKADLSTAQLPAGTNREVWMQPVLSAGDSSVVLPAVAVAGRNRFYQGQRNHTDRQPGLEWIRRSGRDMTIPYEAQVAYRPWMDGAQLSMTLTTRGCCGNPEDDRTLALTDVKFAPLMFHPTFLWIAPTAEGVKTREISGRAYIDFPVSKTAILPDYRRNASELAKIRASIDSVRNDKDVTARSLTIHGYASPEGSLTLNERLAKGRTEALKAYVDGLYHFAPGFIRTDWTAEDWDGLRAWLSESSMPDAKEIIAIIDGPLAPDAREWKIKKTYPDQYAVLLRDVYPGLRHSDYRIEYTVRAFTTADDILRVAATRPQHLSLSEFFTGAKALPEGSKEFAYLFETAARMYPESEIASLNAANAAMAQGALDNAERYLKGAGDGPEAIYARGNLEALRGNYAEARRYFEQAARLKVADAPAALAQLDELESY